MIFPEQKYVSIVPVTKGSEGKGYTYYAIKLGSIGRFLSLNGGAFTEISEFGSNTCLFSTYDEAETKATALGYKIIKSFISDSEPE